MFQSRLKKSAEKSVGFSFYEPNFTVNSSCDTRRPLENNLVNKLNNIPASKFVYKTNRDQSKVNKSTDSGHNMNFKNGGELNSLIIKSQAKNSSIAAKADTSRNKLSKISSQPVFKRYKSSKPSYTGYLKSGKGGQNLDKSKSKKYTKSKKGDSKITKNSENTEVGLHFIITLT